MSWPEPALTNTTKTEIAVEPVGGAADQAAGDMAEAASPHCEPHYTGPASWQSAVEARSPVFAAIGATWRPESRVDLSLNDKKTISPRSGHAGSHERRKACSLSERFARLAVRGSPSSRDGAVARLASTGVVLKGAAFWGGCHLRIKHIVFGAALLGGLASGSGSGLSADPAPNCRLSQSDRRQR